VELVFRRRQLRPADVRRAVEDLPLQVAEIDGVEVDDPERAHTSRREVHRHRRSESAGTDAEDLRRLELALTVHADLRHDEMPRVALDLVVRQRLAHAPKVRLVYVYDGIDAACDRRNDADGVARGDRRLLFLQIPDVFVVHVDIHEAAELSLIVEQVRLEPGVPARQIRQ
jgi:hypothetical protein